MGAGGSTAASCSSLDLTNGGQVPDKYRYYRNQQQYLHEQRMQKYKRQAGRVANNLQQQQQHLRHSSSQFDLTACDMRDDEMYPHDERMQYCPQAQAQVPQPQPAAAAAETYNLTSSDMAARPHHHQAQHGQPVMVLPPLPINITGKHPPLALHKKSNAGVASRILHQRQQQQRSNELKKFSDSLPSLNNILVPAMSPTRHQQQQQQHQSINMNVNAINHHQHKSHLRHHQHQIISPRGHHHQAHDCCDGPSSAFMGSNGGSPSKQMMKASSSSAASSNRSSSAIQAKQEKVTTNANLVTGEASYRLQSPHHWQGQPRQKQQQARVGSKDYKQQMIAMTKPQMMKRATSLSSLHDLNQSHHQPHHNQHHLRHNHHPRDDYNQHQMNIINPRLADKRSPRPPSLNSCAAEFDLLSQQQQPYGVPYRLPPQTTPPISQNGMMLRKNHKYKPAPSVGGHILKSNRYKSKQQQQQQSSAQQQGCPVLPPLPRSQSLHELIQLRATENGQRMRTTGTLRGPFGNGGEQSNKVNLVAELLETRRQQKQAQDKGAQGEQQQQGQVQGQKSETLLSQSSSTDDGIHDVSLNGDTQHSAGDTREKQFSSSTSSNDRSSMSSQECRVERKLAGSPAESRQRVFKKQAGPTKVHHQKLISANSKQQVGLNDSPGHQSGPRQQQQQHKSTLKRSVSHSALHQKRDPYDQDGDESDDLNELARFLYQFKQRQVKGSGGEKGDRPEEGKAKIAEKARQQVSLPVNSQQDQQVNANLQQSPNSTTSSSGFASSTCTSHSISSTSGQDYGQTDSSSSSTASSSSSSSSPKANGAGGGLLLGRKKYPAPPRPDESAKSRQAGKMKVSSSSLLSIVDECQPTGEREKSKSSSKGAAGAKLDCEQEHAHYDQIGELGSRQQLEHLRKYTQLRQMSQSELALNHLTSSTVGLVEPPAAAQAGGGGGRRQQQRSEIMQKAKQKSSNNPAGEQRAASGESGKRPYANRLFNLIRRISDKSETPSGRGSGQGTGDGSSFSGSERSQHFNRARSSCALVDSAGGGQQCNEVGAHHQQRGGGGCRTNDADDDDHDDPHDGRGEINQKSEMMNLAYPNECGHLDRRGAVSGQLAHGGRGSEREAGRGSGFGSGEAGGGFSSGNGLAALRKGRPTSESLCNLNFDCDFELIKNCRSANESSSQAHSHYAQADGGGGPLFVGGNGDSALHNELAAGRQLSILGGSGGGGDSGVKEKGKLKKQKKNKQPAGGCGADHPIIDSTGRENNWRLVPASSLHSSTHYSCSGSDSLHRQHRRQLALGCPLKHDNNNYNNTTGFCSSSGSLEGRNKSATGKTNLELDKGRLRDSSCKVHGKEARGAEGQGLSSSSKHCKSKWSASAWFLGGGGSGEKSKRDGQEHANSKPPAKHRSYLAKLITTSTGGTSTSSSSAGRGSGSKSSKQQVGDEREDGQRACDMISGEADQLLVELDQSLDLVSSARRRRGKSSGGAFGQNPSSVPWWQQVSSEITEEDARMMREAHLSRMPGGEGSSVRSSSSSSCSNSDDSEDERDNDDADYASINRALINETFDVVDLSAGGGAGRCGESGHSNELSITQAGSPSNSFTFSAPNSPELSGRSPQACNSSSQLAEQRRPEIDGGGPGRTTNGLSKQEPDHAGAGKRWAQDKQRSEGNEHRASALPSSSEFTYLRGVKTTTTTTASPLGRETPGAAPTTVTNGRTPNDEREDEARVKESGKRGGGVRNNESSTEGGICRPMGVVGGPKRGAGNGGAKPMAEAADGKLLLSTDNKIVAPAAAAAVPSTATANSDTFTKANPGAQAPPQGVSGRHPARDGQPGKVVCAAQKKGVAHGVAQNHHSSQMIVRSAGSPDANHDERCMTNIVHRQARAQISSDAGGAKRGLACEPRRPDPMSGRHLNDGARDKPTRCEGNNDQHHDHNDVTRLANGSSAASAGCIRLASGVNSPPCLAKLHDHDDCHPSVTGVNCAAPGRNGLGATKVNPPAHARLAEAKAAFNDPSSARVCSIHGQQQQQQQFCPGSCCCRCPACAHSSPGQGEPSARSNLKQQPGAPASVGKRQLDTNSVECCAYDTESSNNGQEATDPAGSKLVLSAKEVFACSQACCDCSRPMGAGGATEARRQIVCAGGVAGQGGCGGRIGSQSGDNGLCSGTSSSSSPSAGTQAGVRTKNGQHKESVVCTHRPGAAIPASGRPAAAGELGNNKLIIQESAVACHCCSGELPRANEKASPPAAGGKQAAASPRRPEESSARSPTAAAAAKAKTNGAGPRLTGNRGGASPEGNASSSSPRVTYYHYSHEMKNFAPTSTPAAPNGKLRGGGGKCCETTAECYQQRRGATAAALSAGNCPVKCSCMMMGKNNSCQPAAAVGAGKRNESELACNSNPHSSSSTPCKVACRYHVGDSTGGSPSSAPSHGAIPRLESNEDVKLAPCCSSHIRAPCGEKNPPDAMLPGKNKALKPMTGQEKDARLAAPAKACCQVPSVAKHDKEEGDECHCCLAAAAGSGAQTNGQVAACLAKFQVHAKCPGGSNLDPATSASRCNPICRSNSELSSAQGQPILQAAQLKQKGRAPLASSNNNNNNNKATGSALFGRLRNSLLNQRAAPGNANNPTDRKHLASSQVSLANHYAAAAVPSGEASPHMLIQSMLMPASAVGHLMGTASSSSTSTTNDFDDNFILKRKTPNAGLKSRC